MSEQQNTEENKKQDATISGAGKITGTTGNDKIVGSLQDDQIIAGDGDDVVIAQSGDDTVVAGAGQDDIDAGSGQDTVFGEAGHDKLLGGAGSDNLDAGVGNDLAAGDYVGDEWQLEGDKWVYKPENLKSDPNFNDGPAAGVSYDDVIVTGDGDDILLGNLGNDHLDAGAGEDIINAGTGDDIAFGRGGDDLINLEDGNDIGFGGRGADIINAGKGDDLVYGDQGGENLLSGDSNGSTPMTMSQYGDSANWDVTNEGGNDVMTTSVSTTKGESFTLSFELAANVAGGAMTGTVEVIWGGEVIGTVSTSSGVFETHSFEVQGTGDDGSLSFRVVDSQVEYDGPEIDMSGPIFSYEKTVTIDGQDIDIQAFAPGQAKLYQVIDGDLKVFDTQAKEYMDAGAPTGFKINAIGYNQQDDLIYGIAKSKGTDALGQPIQPKDIVMLDAQGNAYRIGETPNGDYVGDFDNSGNLWTFNSSLDRVTKIDVDNLDASGNPVIENYPIPTDLFGGRIYDIAYSAKEDAFYAVQAPSKNGGPGQVHKIDMSNVESGGSPLITSVAITQSNYDGDIQAGMAKGAYGAVFLDGDGNLYFGLNRGDHDLDGTTEAQGAIFKVNMDFDAGTAEAEFMSAAQTTRSNDGAVDPRSVDPFAPVDIEAEVLIKSPTLQSNEGGNDSLRGGGGDDMMFGEAGNDELFGGTGDDVLDGGTGDDNIQGGTGDDTLLGAAGNDRLSGGTGDDDLSGGAGRDFLNAGTGDDTLDGGAGNDKLVGGAGEDRITGGAGDDHIWGGNWSGDRSSDTFVVAAGDGKDMIHDFETDQDVIDLSAYGLEYADLSALMQDQGWATVIDLSGLDNGQEGDKLILKSVSADDLDESNFVL